jgi:peptide/nickel transport system substrate-binding protein
MKPLGKTMVLLTVFLPGVGGYLRGAQLSARTEVAWTLKYDPKTLDPAKVDDQASEMVRYLTGGVLLRTNRQTQQVEPALAESWSSAPDGRVVTFHLRRGLHFSDGSPLSSADVVATLRRVLDPATAAVVAEEFVAPQQVSVDAPDALTVTVHLPKRIISIGNVFDEIAIEPANRPGDIHVTAGSFILDEYQRGNFIRLRRNPYYWRHDSAGNPLPYLSAVRLDILANREQEMMRFGRGQYQLIDALATDDYDLMTKRNSASVHDLGASLNTEQMWFNQASESPLPSWEKEWFQSSGFRVAVSKAIHRADLCRIAYEGHATPAIGFISPANLVWYDRQLPAVHGDTNQAAQLLAKEGFRKNGANLVDRQGHSVKFSILTNAGNPQRAKMAALIQQDLAALGMQVTVVTLDFPALIDRLMHSQNYEAALLGLSDVQPDPSEMMNLWLSSSPNHQWNPSEKTPATVWEAEIDRLMQLQAESQEASVRKHAVDRVQEIVAEQQPFIYLVYPNMLYAVSPDLSGVQLSVLQPGIVSNIDMMRWKGNAR